MELEALKVFRSNVRTFVKTFRLTDSAIDKFNAEHGPLLRNATKTARAAQGSDEHLEELKAFATHLAEHLSVKEAVAWQNGWYIVMMVTITEAYFRDALEEAAKHDESFMEKSQQVLEYRDVLKANTIESVRFRMRDAWAKKLVESGGPSKWIEKLVRWGARDFALNAAEVLERMWGIRHVVVHRARKADENFATRHPTIELDYQGRVEISPDDVRDYTLAAIEFVKVTNRYLEDRCSANSRKVSGADLSNSV